MTHMSRGALPPEIAVLRQRDRARTTRLYLIGAGAIGLIIAAIFVVYDVYGTSQIRASQHLAAAISDYERHDAAGAYRATRAAIDVGIHDYALQFNVGLLLLKLGHNDEALLQLRRAEAIHAVPTAYLYAAIAALAEHDPATARAEAQHAADLAAGDPDINAVLAMADAGLGHSTRAAREFATARANRYQGESLAQLIADAGFEGADAGSGGS